MNNDYTIDDIQSLDFRSGVRARIQMYLGSNDLEGVYQAFKEIINNSTDEALAGFGNKIIIDFTPEFNEIKIRDFGRGVPFGLREDGENVLVSIYTKSHTGGKFKQKVYANSSGTNGIGGSCVCLSSTLFTVMSIRDGKKAVANFMEGDLLNYTEDVNNKLPNGTAIYFIPDPKVFTNGDIQYSYTRICEEIKNISYLYKGIHFEINEVNAEEQIINKTVYKAENGIADLIKDTNKNKAVHTNIITGYAADETDSLEIALQWTTGSEQSFTFTNGLYNPEGGTPLTGARTAITRTINNLLSETLTGELARTGLIYVINCKVKQPSFANQTKTKINNANLRTLADKAFSDAIKDFAIKNEKEFKQIELFLTKELKAERAAQKARAAVLEQNSDMDKELKKKVVLAGKLIDCRKHDHTSELWIVEGKSAGSAIAGARDGDHIAVYPARGKGLNALKEKDIEKILANEEYKSIMTALGCGYADKFNIKKLRYGKIVIASDADEDGNAIACLLLAFFYKMYPELLKAGKIYRAETPLFIVEANKKRYYAYNEEELKSLPKGDVERNKGLGSMLAINFKESIFSENGRYTQFTLQDGAQAEYFFNMLLGNELEQRREYLYTHIDWEL